MAGVAFGLTLGVAIVLAFAAILKLRAVTSFEVTLVRLLPRTVWRGWVDSRRAAYAVIGVELLLAGTLIALPSRVIPTLAAFTFLSALSVVAVVARERRLPCHCFGAAHRAAGGLELVRTGGLATTAGALTGLAISGTTSPDTTLTPAAAAAAGFVLMLALLPEVPAASARLAVRLARWSQAGRDEAPDTGATVSRRVFFRRVAAGAATLVALPLVVRTPLAEACPDEHIIDCTLRFNSCFDCCGGLIFLECTGCCDGCYNRCLASIESILDLQCPRFSCFGCWP